MTSVLGHLTSVEFPPDFKSWQYPPPERLFDAPVKTVVSDVGNHFPSDIFIYISSPTASHPLFVGQEENSRKHRKASKSLQCIVYLDRL